MCGQTLGSQTRLGPKSVRIKVEQEGSRSVGKVKGLPRGYREREIGKSPFGVWLGRALSGDVTRLRLRLRIASALSRLGGTQLIANVRVPKALLPEGAADGCITDAEGLVACDVSIQHGRITSVDRHQPAVALLGGLSEQIKASQGYLILLVSSKPGVMFWWKEPWGCKA